MDLTNIDKYKESWVPLLILEHPLSVAHSAQAEGRQFEPYSCDMSRALVHKLK